METFMQTILQISISTAAVTGLLLLLVPVWQQRYSARWRKIIWLVIAIRLLVPFSLELPEAPVVMDVNLEEQAGFTIPVQEAAHTETRYDTAAVPDNQPVTVKPEAQNYAETTIDPMIPVMVQEQEPVSYGTILFAVWILGFAVFAIWHSVQYVMFCRKVAASAMPLEDDDWLLKNASTDMALHRLPNIFISAKVQSPMLVGFKKPVIVLPERIYGEQELLLILRHELMHYKHHDLWYKLILLAANAMHWFNPLVYLMVRQAGRDVEQVCDDNVVAGQDMAYRKAYSMTILNTMANQRGVALSTYLSKDAQNTKKRFAAILQPKQYKRGAAVFLGIVLLAVAASGCLQIGEKDAGVEAYEQIAEFLPEDAIHNPEQFQKAGGENNTIGYLWAENPYEVTEEETYGKDIMCLHKNGKHYLYERALLVYVDEETGRIAGYDYDRKEEKPEKTSEIAGKNIWQKQEYVQKIIRPLIEGDELLFCDYRKANQSYVTSVGVQKYRAVPVDVSDGLADGYFISENTANNYQYLVKLNYDYGYIEELHSWYHDENLAAQVENWLAVEFTRLYEEYYDINSFEVAIAEESRENGKYTVSLNVAMNYRNKGTADENTYLNQLKESGSPDYQQLYEDYEKPQQSIANLKIEAPLLGSKQLSVQGIRLYTAIDDAAGSMQWQEIPGLYVFLKDGEREVAGWNKEKTAVLWAADNYLQAYVSQDVEGMERYSTIEPLITESQYLAGKGYASLEPTGQNFRAHLVEQFQKEYGGIAAVHPDTTVKLRLTLKTYNFYYGEDYLYLTLQKEGKAHWVVTDAYVEEFRI